MIDRISEVQKNQVVIGLFAVWLGCSPQPEIRKLGTITPNVCEASIVVFRDQLWRMEWNKRFVEYRFVNVETGQITKPFQAGRFGSAFVEGDTVYVSTSRNDHIEIIESRDLHSWKKKAETPFPFDSFNTYIAKADGRYILMIETTDIGDSGEIGFKARFAESNDLTHWRLLPETEANHRRRGYSAPHALKYLNGQFYLFYLNRNSNGPYETYVSRSKNLRDWQMGRKPVLSPSADEMNNTSDIDLCEYKGKVRIIYSWGNQQDVWHLAGAEYNGTMREFMKIAF